MDPTNSIVLGYALIVAGFLLLSGELFVPASGTLLVASLVAFVIGVGLIFYVNPTLGVVTLAGLVVALPVAGALLFKVWQRTRLGRKMFLDEPNPEATVAESSLNVELERLKGRYGRATSDLRPSGVVQFEGWRVDAITEGMMVEAGRWVRCIDVRAGRVLVRPADEPDVGRLENLELPGRPGATDAPAGRPGPLAPDFGDLEGPSP
jgi:membrane-bound serine protease (ClpP class)